MYPAERQQVVLVLEAEQLLHILHVAVVGASRLLGNHHVGQQKLVVHLRAREQRSVKPAGGLALIGRSSHQSPAQDAARLDASRCVAGSQQEEAVRQVLGKNHSSQSLHPRRCTHQANSCMNSCNAVSRRHLVHLVLNSRVRTETKLLLLQFNCWDLRKQQ